MSARIRKMAAAALAAGVVAGCGVGLDTNYTDDGYRYTLWVAKASGGGIEALEVVPEDLERVSQRTVALPATVTDAAVDVAVNADSTALVAITGATTGNQLHAFRIAERGSVLAYAASSTVIVGYAPRWVQFSTDPSYQARAQVVSWDGSGNVHYGGVSFDLNVPSAVLSGGIIRSTSAAPIQLVPSSSGGALLASFPAGNPLQGITLAGGNPSSTTPSSVTAGAVTADGYGRTFAAADNGSLVTAWPSLPTGLPDTASPYASFNAQAQVRHLATDRAGRWLFVAGVDGGAGSVRAYALDGLTGGSWTGIVSDVETIGTDPREMAVSPRGRLLALSDCATNRVHIFRVDSWESGANVLRAIGGSPFAVSGCPQGLAWSAVAKR